MADKIEVFVEFSMCGSRFCLLRDTTVMEFVKGSFMTVQEAIDWAVVNGYQCNIYEYYKTKFNYQNA